MDILIRLFAKTAARQIAAKNAPLITTKAQAKPLTNLHVVTVLLIEMKNMT